MCILELINSYATQQQRMGAKNMKTLWNKQCQFLQKPFELWELLDFFPKEITKMLDVLIL